MKIDNELRKINKRMEKLFEIYGADDPVYQHYAARAARSFDIRMRGNGLVQISRSKSNLQQNPFRNEIIRDLINSDTVSTVRARARAYARKTGYDGDIDVLASKMSYVKEHRDIITYISDQIKNGVAITDSMADLYNRAAGRSDELSYDELYTLMTRAVPDYENYYG